MHGISTSVENHLLAENQFDKDCDVLQPLTHGQHLPKENLTKCSVQHPQMMESS